MSRRTTNFTLGISNHTNADCCFKCKKKFKIGDDIVSKRNNKGNGKYYHESCYKGLYI